MLRIALFGVLAAVLLGLHFRVEAQVTAAPNATPTLFIVGDSTASNGADLGWGRHLGKYFDPAKIKVVNRARGGRSSRTFQMEGLWNRVLEELKRGDYLMIQFGHNDGGPIDRDRARGSLRGLGEETQEITHPTGEKEMVHTYGWYLRKYVSDARTKGATPILLSLTVRNEWQEDKVERGPGEMSQWSEAVAQSEKTPFVDLNNIVAEVYEKLGQEKVKELFPIDHTHTSAVGANLNARSVVAGLKGLREPPLNDYLSEAGKAIETYKRETAK